MLPASALIPQAGISRVVVGIPVSGFEEEMQAIRAAIAAGADERIPSLMSDRWLSEVTLCGSPAQVREGIEAWQAAGVRTVIAVPSSTRGNQMVALQELLDLYR